MDRRKMVRVLLEGAINGIGFVIGTTVLGMIVSLFAFLRHGHFGILLVVPLAGGVLWYSFKGRRLLKAKVAEFNGRPQINWTREIH